MRIAINAATLNLHSEAGFATWDRNIIKSLTSVDTSNHYTLYTNGPLREPFLGSTERVVVRNLRPFRWLCRPLSLATGERLGSTFQQMLTVELLLRRPDIYFQTGHAIQPLYYR